MQVIPDDCFRPLSANTYKAFGNGFIDLFPQYTPSDNDDRLIVASVIIIVALLGMLVQSLPFNFPFNQLTNRWVRRLPYNIRKNKEVFIYEGKADSSSVGTDAWSSAA